MRTHLSMSAGSNPPPGTEGVAGGLRAERGMVLLSALLLLAATSLIAVGLASDTATDFQVAGNRRIQQQTFYLADGGVNLGIQITRDFVLNRDEGLVDPQTDYPGSGTISLSSDNNLYMRNFQMNATHVLHDVSGYSLNDNLLDTTNPDQAVNPPDVLFDLVEESSAEAPQATVSLDLDLLARDPWGDIKFATGYDDPVANKWVYYYDVRARATDRTKANADPHAELATVYAVLK